MLVAIFEPSSSAFSSSPVKPTKPAAAVEVSGSETEDDEPPAATTKPSVKGKEKEKTDSRVNGWMYMGSHNWTPSAWGNYSIKKDGTPSLSVSHLVMPLHVRHERLTDLISVLARIRYLPPGCQLRARYRLCKSNHLPSYLDRGPVLLLRPPDPPSVFGSPSARPTRRRRRIDSRPGDGPRGSTRRTTGHGYV
jgi:hypothetical protein